MKEKYTNKQNCFLLWYMCCVFRPAFGVRAAPKSWSKYTTYMISFFFEAILDVNKIVVREAHWQLNFWIHPSNPAPLLYQYPRQGHIVPSRPHLQPQHQSSVKFEYHFFGIFDFLYTD